jgi:hypothetical protein
MKNVPGKKAVLYTYYGVVITGGIRGMGSGYSKFNDWYSTRQPVSINSKMYDPIINTCRDSGMFGFYTLQSGLGSALIVATAPISVPLLLTIFNKDAESDTPIVNSKYK